MSTPPPTTPKGPRNARKQAKRTTTPATRKPSAPNNPSSLARKQAQSPISSNDANVTIDSFTSLPEGGSRKKKERGNKKDSNANSPRAKVDVTNVKPGHRHTSSQPSVPSPLTFRDSPHYAGPTFHASPAPSALPVPSFVSKSVPEGDSPLQIRVVDESLDIDHPGNSTPTKTPALSFLEGQDKNTSSPLDFLFKAAMESRRGNNAGGRDGPPRPSSLAHQDTIQAGPSQDPLAMTDTVFPLDLENSEPSVKTPSSKITAIGPAFATSYKERMNALRSASSPSTPGDVNASNEIERKAKSDALKLLLFNSTQQGPLSMTLGPRNNSPLFSPQSRANMQHHPQPPPGTLTPASTENSPRNIGFQGQNVPFQYVSSVGKPGPAVQSTFSPPTGDRMIAGIRPSDHSYSPLHPSPHRSHSAHSTLHGTYVSPTPNRTVSSLPQETRPVQGVSTRIGPSDTKKMEDDLRRLLKIRVSDAHNGNNMS
ncbi:hypothetical protein LOZ65_000702 [Ophidiomyces ophidiicola]|nr:hypothetical protein LOZ65_000702 [Ophidiomyces ophidiicola]